jgi:hypothetical protein
VLFRSNYNLTTAIHETFERNNTIKLYPNPTNRDFSILLPIGNKEILVTDVLGNIILQTSTKENKVNLQIEKNGIYFINVKTRSGSSTHKLFVNH